MKESDGKLSRSNERTLKGYKQHLCQSTGATVIFPEDRRPVPHGLHKMVAYTMKQIENELRLHDPDIHDGKLFHLMMAIFDFDVDPATIKRYYYTSEEEK